MARDFREYLELEETIACEADHVVAICEAEAEFFASLRPGDRTVTCMPPLPHVAEAWTDVGPTELRQRRGCSSLPGGWPAPNPLMVMA